jgi:enoyl-CoA hydratase/carnithine racemase
MNENAVLYEKPRQHVAVITFNRPEYLNALSREIVAGLREAFERYRTDDDAWVAILTGNGRAFCAGAHLKEHAQDQAEGRPRTRPRNDWLEEESWKPMIAAINGYAMGGGWAFAQRCDIRIMAEDAQIGIPETRWNLPAPFVTSLIGQIPMAIIMELVLTAKPIDAHRAYEIGFANKVVPNDQLMDTAFAYAEAVCENSPLAIRVHKEVIARSVGLHPQVSGPMARHIFEKLLESEDALEGPLSFAERRKPVWKGR